MADGPHAVSSDTTAPSVGTNGHFASIGDHNDPAAYEHGVQVIDEDKQFKSVFFFCRLSVQKPPMLTLGQLLQSQPGQVPVPRRRHQCRLQLPSHLRLRLPVDRQVDPAQPPVRHQVQRHV